LESLIHGDDGRIEQLNKSPSGVYDVCVCYVQKVSSEVRPVWFVFAGMGTQWPHMGRDLMTIDCFRESIMRSDAVLRPHGIQLCDLLMDSKEDTFNDTVNSFVGIAAIQVNSRISDSRKKWSVF